MGNCCGSSSTKDYSSDDDAYGSTRHVRQGYIENSRRQHQTAHSAPTPDTAANWSHTNTYNSSNRGYIPPYHTNPQTNYSGEEYGRAAADYGVTAATAAPSYKQSTAVHTHPRSILRSTYVSTPAVRQHSTTLTAQTSQDTFRNLTDSIEYARGKYLRAPIAKTTRTKVPTVATVSQQATGQTTSNQARVPTGRTSISAQPQRTQTKENKVISPPEPPNIHGIRSSSVPQCSTQRCVPCETKTVSQREALSDCELVIQTCKLLEHCLCVCMDISDTSAQGMGESSQVSILKVW